MAQFTLIMLGALVRGVAWSHCSGDKRVNFWSAHPKSGVDHLRRAG
jgi:hypothetical protein